MDQKRGLLIEFAVIVLGVLVALAADEWVEKRGRHAEGRSYLEALRDDLAADSARAADGIEAWNTIISAGDSVLALVSRGTTNAVSAANRGELLVNSGGYWSVIDLTSPTYEALKAEGDFSLFENRELLRRVIGYNESRVSVAREAEMRRAEIRGYFRFTAVAVDPRHDPTMTWFSNRPTVPQRVDEQYGLLASEREYRLMLEAQLRQGRWTRGLAQELVGSTTTLLQAIDEELAR